MSSSIKRTALTLGGIFIRSSSRVLNEILGGNPPAGPDLNAQSVYRAKPISTKEKRKWLST